MHNPSLFEKVFEVALWRSRLVVYLAVVCSMLAAFALFYVTVVEVYYTLAHLTHYAGLDDVARAELRANTVAHIVGSVDGFLLAIVLLIFAFGIYELFISDIRCAADGRSSKVLIIESLDDLKSRLASVILMILVVIFFEHAIHFQPNGIMDLLYFAVAISLISLALYLLHKSHEHPDHGDADHSHSGNDNKAAH
ncbi:MAG TPA: YqhA family protein [Thiotrichales bacterium]|nr:YqhA family protein [Thiotrichales bacterium]HQT03923.1 YqhA family protein [Thiotrichales bacterium]